MPTESLESATGLFKFENLGGGHTLITCVRQWLTACNAQRSRDDARVESARAEMTGEWLDQAGAEEYGPHAPRNSDRHSSCQPRLSDSGPSYLYHDTYTASKAQTAVGIQERSFILMDCD
jgi:hypothetical protein